MLILTSGLDRRFATRQDCNYRIFTMLNLRRTRLRRRGDEMTQQLGERGAQSVLPAKMRAVVMRAFGGPEVLHLEEVDTPVVDPGDILVKIGAVEVSRSRDVATRSGRHPYSRQIALPHVLGGDAAGVVVATGRGVDPALLGTRVAVMNHRACGSCPACAAGRPDDCSALVMLGVHRRGSYAEYVSVRPDQVHELPCDLDFAEAAALAATGPVALTQLETAGVGEGTTVLLTGMSGALASTLAVLAHAKGARVIGLSRRPVDVSLSLGVAAVLDVNRPDLADAIVAATGGGPRVVIDNVCVPEVFERYYPVLPHGARVVVSGAIDAPGPPVLAVPARTLYLRSIGLMGVRSHTTAVTAEFWQLVHAGFRLPAGIVHEYPLERVAEMHDAISRNATAGHTVLRVTSADSEAGK
jgi:D-arabinose 1-dehydrogenase-like Zn-dependent alcohol dehydrogenase